MVEEVLLQGPSSVLGRVQAERMVTDSFLMLPPVVGTIQVHFVASNPDRSAIHTHLVIVIRSHGRI